MQIEYSEALWIDERPVVPLEELAERSGLSESQLRELVDYGALALGSRIACTTISSFPRKGWPSSWGWSNACRRWKPSCEICAPARHACDDGAAVTRVELPYDDAWVVKFTNTYSRRAAHTDRSNSGRGRAVKSARGSMRPAMRGGIARAQAQSLLKG